MYWTTFCLLKYVSEKAPSIFYQSAQFAVASSADPSATSSRKEESPAIDASQADTLSVPQCFQRLGVRLSASTSSLFYRGVQESLVNVRFDESRVRVLLHQGVDDPLSGVERLCGRCFEVSPDHFPGPLVNVDL